MDKRKVIVVFALISVLLISLVVYQKFEYQHRTIQELTELSAMQQRQIKDLRTIFSELKIKLNISEEKLSQEKTQKEKLVREIFELKRTLKSDYAVIGIDPEGKGSVIPLEVKIESGNESLFLDVANVLFDETLQSSAQTAAKVAGEITKMNLEEKDILIILHAPETPEKPKIAGGSGGAAMTIAIVAAMEGRNISKDVLITGTVEEYHTIGRVGAIREKGMAAKEWGAKKFIVPMGQNVSIQGLDVKEVLTIEEALEYIAPVTIIPKSKK